MNISIGHRTVYPPGSTSHILGILNHLSPYNNPCGSTLHWLQLSLNLSGLSALGAMHAFHVFLFFVEKFFSFTHWETISSHSSMHLSFSRHFLSTNIPALGLGQASAWNWVRHGSCSPSENCYLWMYWCFFLPPSHLPSLIFFLIFLPSHKQNLHLSHAAAAYLCWVFQNFLN